MNPENISIQDYTYALPEERIAKYPLQERDSSKLLIHNKETITEDIYRNIADHLPQDSLLIFNNTKVVEARLLFQKSTGGIIEIFCLEPHSQYPDITTAMKQKNKVLWQCLVGGASKWKKGQLLKKEIRLENEMIILTAAYIEKPADAFTIELSWSPGELSFAEILHHAGAIPLPPYIKRKVEPSDAERYQTIYAEQDGSVAAPTAGLHFTDHIFHTLQQKGIAHHNVTLHVGAGTFKPVTAEKMQDHIMHAEYIDVSLKVIKKIRENIDQKKIIAVGTTSLRTIETLYWAGLKCIAGNKETDEIAQWEPYLPYEEISAKEAMDALIKELETKNLDRFITKTRLLIAPGYNFKIISGLITNFHQPGSTLLLLVAALTGDNWKNIYEYALNNDFRFLSYGDGCLLRRDINSIKQVE